MKLSIVTTLYYSAPYIDEFYRRACSVAEEITEHFEIVFVNDGSPDNSLELALSLHRKNPRICVIDLSRNFGHHKAMMTGLAHAKGDLVFLIDSDLEEDPELLRIFLKELQNREADVVYGVLQKRKGNWFERFSGYLFYKLFNLLSNYPIPANVITARLMSQRYVNSLVQYRDQEIFLAGLWAITGYEQVPVMVEKKSKGDTVYNLRRKLSIFVNSVTSFSNRPLIYISYLGILISVIASMAATYLIVQRLFFGVFLTGWASLIVSVWLLGGLTIFCLGIIGIYLSKIFMETKQRPYTVIRHIYGSAE